MSGPPRQLRRFDNYGRLFAALMVGLCCLGSLSCQPQETENSGSFYSESAPPRKQEFRWSNGRSPKSFDPAQATAPPETDIVRAIYEGLTDLDSRTLREVPAIAEKWTASPDNRTWIFQLRKDAKWSNGEAVTARDFVRSWKRLAELGEKVPNRNLSDNIVGMRVKPEVPAATPTPAEAVKDPAMTREPSSQFGSPKRQGTEPETPGEKPKDIDKPDTIKPRESEKLGFEAVSDTELKVSLVSPDKDFPRLVANPIFRPVYGDGKYFDDSPLGAEIVTNGPFQISSIDQYGILLARSDKYWNRDTVTLESVRFVPALSAEKALDSYRSGEIDALTNADFEPLALKLLTPYSDFRQATHNALNFYEVNTTRAPFSDRRIREALAISIERDRLTENEMKGSTEPAYHFLPYDLNAGSKLLQDVERARKLLQSAGFPDGEGFPAIHLVVNRNETQLRIARSVIRMWKQNLNLNAEIVVKETSEMEAIKASGDYDIIRRGVVFPTVDKKAGFAALFPTDRKMESEQERPQDPVDTKSGVKPSDTRSTGPTGVDRQTAETSSQAQSTEDIATDAALFDFRIIPLYFPVSYGLVKPYVQGFELNGLDAPSLKDIRIDSDWQPKAAN